MSKAFASFTTLAIVLIAAAPLSAQRATRVAVAPPALPSVSFPRPQNADGVGHSGFHAAVGLGGGSVGVSCDDCSDDREEGGVLMLRFGGAMRPGLVLSGEITNWNKKQDNADENLSFVLVTWQFYPDPLNSGLFWKLGAGVSAIRVTVDPPGFASGELRTSSLGLSVGGGYDIRVARGFGLTPFIDLMLGAESDAKFNGGSTGEKLGANLIHLGLAASWR